MSFSGRVKQELAKHISSGRHCRLAELSALVTMSGTYASGIWQPDRENVLVREKTDKLRQMLELDINSGQAHQALKLKEASGRLLTDRILVERGCCKKAYIRGAFLANGSVTDPAKGYHFELVSDSGQQAELLLYIISDFGLEPKIIRRKRYYVVYLKDGSMIVDILNIMGAPVSLMNMENVRILKDMRNVVNRRVNCETANINKTVSAAVKQLEDIEYIERKEGLQTLAPPLREIAMLRQEQPELPLKELGERLCPPLGKSGVNHRLRKISEIADELRRRSYD